MPEMINVEEARAYALEHFPSPVVRRPIEALLDNCPRVAELVRHGENTSYITTDDVDKYHTRIVLDEGEKSHFCRVFYEDDREHGRWEWYEEYGPSTWLEPPDILHAGWKCSECKIDLGEYLTEKLHEEVYVGDMDKMPEVNHCPNCGAKMDLE